MFLNQGENKEKPTNNYSNYPSYQNPNSSESLSMGKMVFFFISGIIFLSVLAGASYYFFIYEKPRPDNIVKNSTEVKTEISTSTAAGLPEDINNENNEEMWLSTSTENIKAEDLAFGFFYTQPKNDFNVNIKNYTLPINTKTDVSNYYDIARKIDLDPYLSSLDQQGFTIITPDLKLKSDDFFSVYQYLISKGIPVTITNDFLYYYYQNTFKQVFKEIEKSTFYDNLWDINKKLYDISLARYKKRYDEVGMSNDPILEAERLEMAYFAVTLNLLKPLPEQISTKSELVEASKYSPQEADNYSFEMPATLKDDVEKEVSLIRAAKETKKSPVFLYQKNYKDFIVPKNYGTNAKLNNFYLGMKWLNSEFPLYYTSKECPSCLLDYDDWTINIIASSFITKDLMTNQDIKNNWAVVYKFIAFYTGLRQDLTYLQYHNALTKLFGADYKIEDIFSSSNPDRKNSLKKLANEVAGNRFSDLEGSFDRTNPATKPLIGMRLLQEPYWPNDYIFKNLTGADKKMKQSGDVFTSCLKNENYFRCLGFGLDIVNLINFNNTDIQTDYLLKNTTYSGYNEAITKLRSEIGKFNVNSWNNNVFWSSLDISKVLLENKNSKMPVYAQNAQWTKYKNLNTILGGWVNLHLPEDTFINKSEVQGSALGEFMECNRSNYIEPNREFVNELIARNQMLMRMLSALNITNKTSSALLQLKDLDSKLTLTRSIMEKELKGEILDDEDCKFINEFVSHNAIVNKGDRSITMKIGNHDLIETIKDIKLVGIIYPIEDKKVLTLGPIFSFTETK